MNIFEQSQSSKHHRLGKEMFSWVYTPTSSTKTLFIVLGILAVIIPLAISFADEILPFIKQAPEFLIYLIPILIGPIASLFKSQGSKQQWTLYEHGFVRTFLGGKSGGKGEEKIGYWRDYVGADYNSERVILKPRSIGNWKAMMPANENVIQIYTLCRERISIAVNERMSEDHRPPSAPDSKEQRQVAKMYERHQRELAQNIE